MTDIIARVIVKLIFATIAYFIAKDNTALGIAFLTYFVVVRKE